MPLTGSNKLYSVNEKEEYTVSAQGTEADKNVFSWESAVMVILYKDMPQNRFTHLHSLFI